MMMIIQVVKEKRKKVIWLVTQPNKQINKPRPISQHPFDDNDAEDRQHQLTN